MKRKITIGFWIAVIVVFVGFAAVIFNDLRFKRMTRETEEMLKTTMISVDFDSVPLDEAWQLIRTEAIKGNPEFAKIDFDSSWLTNTDWSELTGVGFDVADVGTAKPGVILITLKLVDAPVVQVVRYTSSLGSMKYDVNGRTIHLLETGHVGIRTMTGKIRLRIYKTKDRIKEKLGLEPDTFRYF